MVRKTNTAVQLQTSCRWCLSSNVERLAYGVVAPWILRHRCTKDDVTSLMLCLRCGLRFFTREFSESELADIYGEYRKASYLTKRQRWEPWYSKRINDAIGHDSSIVEHRRKHVEQQLEKYLRETSLQSPSVVVDFGGDAGQFIPSLPSIEKRFVMEVSDAQTEAGVMRLQSWEQIKEVKPNLIMMCHVLEHTQDARELVQSAYNSLEPGGVVYIEVPLDCPPSPRRMQSSRFYASYTRFLARSRPLFIPIDLVSLVSRRLLKKALPGGVTKQSEHIQFFDLKAFEEVLKPMGFVKLEATTYLASGSIPRLNTVALGVLASKPH